MKKFLTQTSFVLASYLMLPLCLMSADEDIRSLSRAATLIRELRYSMTLPIPEAITNAESTDRDSISTLLENGQFINIESLGFATTDTMGENSIPQKPSALFSLTNALGADGPLRRFITENKLLGSRNRTNSKKMKIDFQTTLAVPAPLGQSGIVKLNLDLAYLQTKEDGAMEITTKNFGFMTFTILDSTGSSATPWRFYESQLRIGSGKLVQALQHIIGKGKGSLFLQVSRDNSIAGNYPASVQFTNLSISSGR